MAARRSATHWARLRRSQPAIDNRGVKLFFRGKVTKDNGFGHSRGGRDFAGSSAFKALAGKEIDRHLQLIVRGVRWRKPERRASLIFAKADARNSLRSGHFSSVSECLLTCQVGK